MFTRILVPLDGSPLAEQTLPYVRILGAATNTPHLPDQDIRSRAAGPGGARAWAV